MQQGELLPPVQGRLALGDGLSSMSLSLQTLCLEAHCTEFALLPACCQLNARHVHARGNGLHGDVPFVDAAALAAQPLQPKRIPACAFFINPTHRIICRRKSSVVPCTYALT